MTCLGQTVLARIVRVVEAGGDWYPVLPYQLGVVVPGWHEGIMQSPSIHGKPAPDVLVIGAGIFGLSVAWSCRKAGLSVRVLEAHHPGAGASGGIVGALTPHAPGRWRPMMAFQFRALLSLPDRIAEIEAATGRDCGYARTGRLTPLPTEKTRAGAERDLAAAPETWGTAASYEILDSLPPEAQGRLSSRMAAHGVVCDTVSARVWPRGYVEALKAALADCIDNDTPVRTLDPAAAKVEGQDGSHHAGHIVLAAGPSLWALAAPHLPGMAKGSAVKGQAAVLSADLSALPVVYTDGLYVIPHGPRRVSVGSTSEKRFDEPFRTDRLLDALLVRARRVVPALAGAAVIERWAGLRPKSPGREPVVGALPGHPRTWLAGGGFKISFGIAHAAGDAVAAGIAGTEAPIPLPSSFDPAALAG